MTGRARTLPILLPFWGALCVAALCAKAAQAGVAGSPSAPARIVGLTASVTETLFAIGAGPHVVAVSDYCDFPAEAAALPRVGTFLAPVVERVLSIEPDLVLTSPTPGNRNAVEAIEHAGVRVGVVSEGSASIEDGYSSMLEAARLVGRADRGGELVAAIRSRMAELRNRVAHEPVVRVAMVVDFDPLVLAGPSSYLGDLIEAAGGEN